MTNTCADITGTSRGKPEVLGLERELPLSREFEQSPLLAGRNSFDPPHAHSAFADAQRLSDSPLGAEDFLNPLNGTHDRTSHAVKSDVKLLREGTPASFHVKMGPPLIALVPATGMSRGKMTSAQASRPVEIGRRLEATRRALGVTAAAICRATGIKENTWSNYGNPKRKSRPSLDEMIAFCDRYPSVTLDWIYRGRIEKLDHDLAVGIQAAMAELDREGAAA